VIGGVLAGRGGEERAEAEAEDGGKGRVGDGLLGWKMGLSNFIFGGASGYSGVKVRRAQKLPPETGVSSPSLNFILAWAHGDVA